MALRRQESSGYEVSRRLNESMGTYVVAQLVKTMTKKRIQVEGANVLVMGLTFKEDCPDLRVRSRMIGNPFLEQVRV
jgi:UDP-N-acetyl-D-mannosaminuronate dehydrogenase